MFSNQFVFLVLFSILGKCPSEINKSSVIYEDYYPRVVNGWAAKLGDVPYQVGFKGLASRTRQLYMTFCGGTIVTPSKVLSAAHCFVADMSACVRVFVNVGHVDQSKLSSKYAAAGTLKNIGNKPKGDNTDEGQWRALKEAIYPKTYKFPKDDIALVFLLQDFQYNNNVGPIPYAMRYADYTGKCLVSGYGQIVTVGTGDSGGPLVCKGTADPNDKGAGVLVGIVSGHRSGVGSFFTRVSSFYRYIERNKSSSIHDNLIRFVYAIIILAQSLPF